MEDVRESPGGIVPLQYQHALRGVPGQQRCGSQSADPGADNDGIELSLGRMLLVGDACVSGGRRVAES